MPIVVPCPACGTRLSAPDSAAGKHVRCPKPGCGALAEVPALIPAEEVPVVEATPVTAPRRATDEDDRPRAKRHRDEDEEDRPAPRRKRRRDDENDEFDYPRRRRKTSGTGAGAVAAVVLGGLVLLGGVGYGVYALVGKKSADSAKKTPPPAGWKQFTYESDNFRAYFPQEPSVNSMGGFGGFGGFNLQGASVPDSVSVYLPRDLGMNGSAYTTVTVLRYTSPPPAGERQRMRDAIFKDRGRGPRDVKAVRWLGVDAEEVAGQRGLARFAFAGTALYAAEIVGSGNARATADEENGFFDNFELIK